MRLQQRDQLRITLLTLIALPVAKSLPSHNNPNCHYIVPDN
jgi:hypothetical protein